MADNCISVYFSDSSGWDYCWEDGSAYGSWAPKNVTTGLRKSLSDPAADAQVELNEGTAPRAWKTCQYFLNGMPAICKWWAEGNINDEEGTTTSGEFYCSYIKANTSDNPQDPEPDQPSGYNYTHCDFLGRRQWCDKYEKSVPDNLEEYICTAPNPYLTGLGLKSQDDEKAILNPVPRSRIWGYNDKGDGTGTGQCDCHGFGRGPAGCVFEGTDLVSIQEEIVKKPIVCNFYRPFQMGFGNIEPSKKLPGDVDVDGVTITDRGWQRAKEWEADIEYRLPLNYEMYNRRAQFQKCQWWDEDFGRDYLSDGSGFLYLDGDPDIFDSSGRVEFCKNTSIDTIPYNTRALEDWIANPDTDPFTSQLSLRGLWAKAGGPVCNGCRPDCPGFSGKWHYITNDKMLPGMPVTANQVLELRFWSADWDSQTQYDEFYSHKPNFDDARTPDIYTFTKWKKLDPLDASKSIMLGHKLSLCQPAPINNKEFTTDYITSIDIKYVPEEIGTNVETQYHFPSLVRNPNYIDINPLSVLYPYYNDDVFDAQPCLASGPAGHIKRHNTIYGDSVKTIGYTIRDRKVYVINGSIVPHEGILHDYAGVYSTNNLLIKQSLYRALRDIIKEAQENYPDYITSTTSNSTFGYFITDSIKLKYNSANIILICVDYGDGSWEYRWRVVYNRWYGGLLKQNSYSHEYGNSSSGYSNDQPSSINPSAEATMTIAPLGGSVNGDLLSSYSFNNILSGITYYSWSIKWITEDYQEQNNWGPVGNTNIILAEIDDININYIFDWEILDAYLEAKTDEDGNKIGGENIPDIVELEALIEDDDSLPPNFCILKPKEDIRYRFFNSTWTLYISYRYKKFVNDRPEDNDDVVAGGNSAPSNFWINSPYSLTYDNSLVTITDITTGPVKLLGYFYDETGRLIATNATKIVVNIVNEKCRCVDIKYQYYAETMKMALQPEGGFCIDIASVAPTGETVRILETPNCADHEYSIFKWEGPMWFPFNACRGYDLYDEWTICNHCQSGYVGPNNAGVAKDSNGNVILIAGTAVRRYDFRYCGPHQRKAYGKVRSAIPSPCNCGCKFYFADARNSTVVFSGYSRLRAPVDELEYSAQSWTLPPFGNDGREYVEKYLSNDYIQHVTKGNSVSSEWMPLVMDHSMFYLPDFNCFSINNTEDEFYYISPSYSNEPFYYTNQLNLFTIPEYEEEIKNNRYRWEDIFEVEHEGNCSYPLPAYPINSNVTKAIFYYFKNNKHAWAWQEYWKDIERGLNGKENKFKFLELEKPKYAWSAYKEENRLICAEGLHNIIYTFPGIDEETGELSSYPTLAIDDGPPRAFNILYNVYDDSQISWIDDGGSATVSGSSDEDNIYEEAQGNDWIHSENIIFDSEAVSTTDSANEIVVDIDEFTGETTSKYYNRGLIANITREKLDYLPKNTDTYEYIKSDDVSGLFGELAMSNTKLYDGNQLIPGKFVWNEQYVEITPISGSLGISISNLYIKGTMGYILSNTPGVYNELVKPTVGITATFADGSVGTPRGYGSLSSEVITPASIIGVPTDSTFDYVIDIDFALGPEELLRKKRIENFTITITGWSNSFISFKEFNITLAELKVLGDSTDQTESIKVWERKYLVSEMDEIAHNLDGPGNYLKYDLNLKNGGQYFPFKGSSYADLELYSSDAHSKLRSVSCGLRYTEDQDVDITYDTLHEVEKNEQKYWYEYAFDKDDVGDELVFNNVSQPKLSHILDDFEVKYSDLGNMVITSEKRPWEKTEEFKRFKQYDYWRPGGHSYDWSQYWRREKCFIFDTPHTIFEGDFRHHTHPYTGEVSEVGETILNSYYNLRFETIVAKYARAEILSSGEVPNDLLTSANPYSLL